eukprot:SAG31_NODE_1658_length_7616_cov_2.929227_4_plen_657_part_00
MDAAGSDLLQDKVTEVVADMDKDDLTEELLAIGYQVSEIMSMSEQKMRAQLVSTLERLENDEQDSTEESEKDEAISRDSIGSNTLAPEVRNKRMLVVQMSPKESASQASTDKHMIIDQNWPQVSHQHLANQIFRATTQKHDQQQSGNGIQPWDDFLFKGRNDATSGQRAAFDCPVQVLHLQSQPVADASILARARTPPSIPSPRRTPNPRANASEPAPRLSLGEIAEGRPYTAERISGLLRRQSLARGWPGPLGRAEANGLFELSVAADRADPSATREASPQQKISRLWRPSKTLQHRSMNGRSSGSRHPPPKIHATSAMTGIWVGARVKSPLRPTTAPEPSLTGNHHTPQTSPGSSSVRSSVAQSLSPSVSVTSPLRPLSAAAYRQFVLTDHEMRGALNKPQVLALVRRIGFDENAVSAEFLEGCWSVFDMNNDNVLDIDEVRELVRALDAEHNISSQMEWKLKGPEDTQSNSNVIAQRRATLPAQINYNRHQDPEERSRRRIRSSLDRIGRTSTLLHLQMPLSPTRPVGSAQAHTAAMRRQLVLPEKTASKHAAHTGDSSACSLDGEMARNGEMRRFPESPHLIKNLRNSPRAKRRAQLSQVLGIGRWGLAPSSPLRAEDVRQRNQKIALPRQHVYRPPSPIRVRGYCMEVGTH